MKKYIKFFISRLIRILEIEKEINKIFQEEIPEQLKPLFLSWINLSYYYESFPNNVNLSICFDMDLYQNKNNILFKIPPFTNTDIEARIKRLLIPLNQRYVLDNTKVINTKWYITINNYLNDAIHVSINSGLDCMELDIGQLTNKDYFKMCISELIKFNLINDKKRDLIFNPDLKFPLTWEEWIIEHFIPIICNTNWLLMDIERNAINKVSYSFQDPINVSFIKIKDKVTQLDPEQKLFKSKDILAIRDNITNFTKNKLINNNKII